MKVVICGCADCKKMIEVPISSALLFKKVTCPYCKQVYRVTEELNPHSKLPMYLASFVGILSTLPMNRDSYLFLPVFIFSIVISYFMIRFIMYALGYFKVYLERFYL